MSDGLVTRIGRWIDRKWQEKATEGELQELQRLMNERIANVEMSVSKMDISELKTRIEKIELYSGMTRRVDPTKPPVVKGAFEM